MGYISIFLIKDVLFIFPKVQQDKAKHFEVTSSYSEANKIKTREQHGLDRKPDISSFAPPKVKNLPSQAYLKSFETISGHGASIAGL